MGSRTVPGELELLRGTSASAAASPLATPPRATPCIVSKLCNRCCPTGATPGAQLPQPSANLPEASAASRSELAAGVATWPGCQSHSAAVFGSCSTARAPVEDAKSVARSAALALRQAPGVREAGCSAAASAHASVRAECAAPTHSTSAATVMQSPALATSTPSWRQSAALLPLLLLPLLLYCACCRTQVSVSA